jgi:hypothetical protein
MMLLADESVDRPIVERLRQDGHDTSYVGEFSPSIKDEQVLQEANKRNALLVTEDKDFGELAPGRARYSSRRRPRSWILGAHWLATRPPLLSEVVR